MNGFQPYVPVAGKLKRLQLPTTLVKKNQKGAGINSTVKIVSPTEQLVEQAKESLKRNKEENKNLGSSTVITNSSSPPPKKKKTGNPAKKTTKKTVSKTSKIHSRYGKKLKKEGK